MVNRTCILILWCKQYQQSIATTNSRILLCHFNAKGWEKEREGGDGDNSMFVPDTNFRSPSSCLVTIAETRQAPLKIVLRWHFALLMRFRQTHFSLTEGKYETVHLDPRVPLCYSGIDHTFGVCRASRVKEHVESSLYTEISFILRSRFGEVCYCCS